MPILNDTATGRLSVLLNRPVFRLSIPRRFCIPIQDDCTVGAEVSMLPSLFQIEENEARWIADGSVMAREVEAPVLGSTRNTVMLSLR